MRQRGREKQREGQSLTSIWETKIPEVEAGNEGVPSVVAPREPGESLM